jgi:phosphoglycerol transferase MdoB-like AlkP superfamily enzyme
MQKEEVRATLVVGLIASIIALERYVPRDMPVVSIVFGVLVVYWFLYAIFSAYGISETESVRLSNCLRRLGDLSFRFPIPVFLGILWMIFLEKCGVVWVPKWNYLVAWLAMVILYLAYYVRPRRVYHTLKQWKEFKSNFKDHFWNVVVFFIMSLPLLVLQFSKWIFGG